MLTQQQHAQHEPTSAASIAEPKLHGMHHITLQQHEMPQSFTSQHPHSPVGNSPAVAIVVSIAVLSPDQKNNSPVKISPSA